MFISNAAAGFSLHTVQLLLQLAAGEEHSIRGKTVRVNRAGPRPALHLQSTSDPARPQQVPTSTVPIAGGVSRQRGGFSLAEPSSSGSLHPSIGMFQLTFSAPVALHL